MRAVEEFHFLPSLLDLLKSFLEWVDGVRGIRSSKEIVQPFYHAESSNMR